MHVRTAVGCTNRVLMSAFSTETTFVTGCVGCSVTVGLATFSGLNRLDVGLVLLNGFADDSSLKRLLSYSSYSSSSSSTPFCSFRTRDHSTSTHLIWLLRPLETPDVSVRDQGGRQDSSCSSKQDLSVQLGNWRDCYRQKRNRPTICNVLDDGLVDGRISIFQEWR